jgi:hypothetical protein
MAQEPLLRILAPCSQRMFIHGVLNESQATTNGHIPASHFMRLAPKANERIFHGWRQPALGLLIGGEGKCASWQRSLIRM